MGLSFEMEFGMPSVRKTSQTAPTAVTTRIGVLGSELVPDDIASEGLLTPEDYRAIALDHIERTSDAVYTLQIVLKA